MARKIAAETVYFTADYSRVVREGDPDAAFLLVRKGSEVDPGVAEKYSIQTEDYAEIRTALPGANSPEVAARTVAAAREANAAMTANRDLLTDAGVSRQQTLAVRGDVARETGAPPTEASRAAVESAERSLVGGDLLTGTGAAKAAGQEVGAAYTGESKNGDTGDGGGGETADDTDPNRKTPSETAETAGSNRAASSVTKEIAAPPGVNATGIGQGYTEGTGVAVPGAGSDPRIATAGGASPTGASVSTGLEAAEVSSAGTVAPLAPLGGGATGAAANVAAAAGGLDTGRGADASGVVGTSPADSPHANAPATADASESNAAEQARLRAERESGGTGAGGASGGGSV